MKENYKKLLKTQIINELTESEVYARLAELEKNEANKKILKRISVDEKSHAAMISRLVQIEGLRVNKFTVRKLVTFARLFGLTFSLKLMERGEDLAGKKYRGVVAEYPELAKIAEDEERHEKELLGMLDDSHLSNMGSIVLGLNDALVELTGALAGFSHAMCDTNQVAKLGLITGMAAAMSMAASSFLSARADAKANDTSEEENKSPMISAFYTGIAYVITVFLLVAPYFFFSNLYCALITMLLIAFAIIAFFNFYLSVARETSFRRGFLEMAGISTIVALISYGIGTLLR